MTNSGLFWWVLIIVTAFVSLMTFGWLLGAGPVEVCGGTISYGTGSGGQMQDARPLFEGCRKDWNWGTTIPIAIFLLASVAATLGSIVGLRGAIHRNRTAYLRADID